MNAIIFQWKFLQALGTKTIFKMFFHVDQRLSRQLNVLTPATTCLILTHKSGFAFWTCFFHTQRNQKWSNLNSSQLRVDHCIHVFLLSDHNSPSNKYVFRLSLSTPTLPSSKLPAVAKPPADQSQMLYRYPLQSSLYFYESCEGFAVVRDDWSPWKLFSLSGWSGHPPAV